MRKALFASIFGVLVGLGLIAAPLMLMGQVGPPNQIQCNQAANLTIASATTTSAVAGVTGARINICGWHVTTTQAAASNTFSIEYGTQGGPCTTPTVLVGPVNISNTAPSADHIDYASLSIPLGAQLCVVTTGTTVGTNAIVFYSQQ